MLKQSTRFTYLDFLTFVFQSIPGLAWIGRLPTARRRMILSTQKVLHRTSEGIIERKKKEIQQEFKAQNLSSQEEKSFLEDAHKSKDLLYLMIKANMARDVKPSERLDNEELLGQMTTLLLAGESQALSFLLYHIKV